MEEKIKRLAQTRKEIETMKAEADNIKEAALSNAPGYYDLLEDIQLAQEAESILDSEIRAEAVEVCKETKNKNPHPAVTVKTFVTVAISNLEAAREWCIKNFTPALKLDTKTFEKAAKDKTIPTDLVTIGEELRAQIAQNLDAYLD